MHLQGWLVSDAGNYWNSEKNWAYGDWKVRKENKYSEKNGNLYMVGKVKG